MKISQRGIELIKEFEGCVLTAYRDPVGIWTIGYGHTAGVKQGQSISKQQAENILKADLCVYEKGVCDCIKVAVNQNQFDALVSFAYNLGVGALQGSTLIKKLNQGDYNGTANEFDKWINAGGKVLQGLVRRRAAEKSLFKEGDIQSQPTYQTRNEWVRVLQKEVNDQGFGKLVIDGIAGPKTLASLPVVKQGARGNITKLIQEKIGVAQDGIFGTNTLNAIKNFQSQRALNADGIVGSNTWKALLK